MIGQGVTAVPILASLVILNYGKYKIGDVLVLTSAGMALAGCITSWWREWVAGILFIATAVELVTSVSVYRYYTRVAGSGVSVICCWYTISHLFTACTDATVADQ